MPEEEDEAYATHVPHAHDMRGCVWCMCLREKAHTGEKRNGFLLARVLNPSPSCEIVHVFPIRQVACASTIMAI